MDTPDSASRVFCGRFLSMVNTDDVNAIILAQKNMLDRFEKTNEMLLNFNNLSSVRLQQMSERFMHHTRTLVDMKRDLDSIFRRISGARSWTMISTSLALSMVLQVYSTASPTTVADTPAASCPDQNSQDHGIQITRVPYPLAQGCVAWGPKGTK
ncbi:kxDL motif-containing protein 1 isoform X6 [Rattus norvegicus]